MNTDWDRADVSARLWRALVDHGVPPERRIHRVDTKGEAERIKRHWHHWKSRESSQYHKNRADGVWLKWDKSKNQIVLYRGLTKEQQEAKTADMVKATWRFGNL